MRRQVFTQTVRSMAAAAGLLSAVAASATDSLVLVTAHAPPLSIVSPATGEVTGTTTARLVAALSEAGITYTIAHYPWARALGMAKADPQTCAYPAVRSPDRESRFKWIGPADVSVWALFGRAGERPPLALDQVKERMIGGSLGDAATQYLKDQGFKLDESRDDTLNLRKLQTGRIDFWVNNLATGLYLTSQAQAADIVPVLSFKENPIFLACNLSVPDQLVDRLSQILQRRAAEPQP